jgi:hypothetical protein
VVAQASSPSALTTSAQVTSGTSGVNSLPLPTVTSVPQRGDDDEHEGRERGGRERDHDDDRYDDDRHEDDRHEDEDDD